MKVIIGDATLYLGDCMDILPTLDKVDAVITDPPYGISETGNNSRQKAPGLSRLGTKTRVIDYPKMDWDDYPPATELINAIRNKATWCAFFGGNYFELPPTSCWLVWDKLNSGDFADCELAWTNWPKAVRRIQWRWNGMIRQGNEERYHPTQKPIGVMKWVIELCPKAETILDPFMGSGTTGVAAIQMGRKFIGIEREPKYFDIACKRIEQASKQIDMFIEQPKQEQTSFL
jgi:site-specific DNA-methyltransferase (adenine-specific)/modification methylase